MSAEHRDLLQFIGEEMKFFKIELPQKFICMLQQKNSLDVARIELFGRIKTISSS